MGVRVVVVFALFFGHNVHDHLQFLELCWYVSFAGLLNQAAVELPVGLWLMELLVDCLVDARESSLDSNIVVSLWTECLSSFRLGRHHVIEAVIRSDDDHLRMHLRISTFYL